MKNVQLTDPQASLINYSSLGLTIKAAAITFVTLTLFFNDLTLIFSDALQSETTSYILVVPFIFIYMLYRKRKTLKVVVSLGSNAQPTEIKHFPTISGILLAATSILLYWHGSYTFTPIEYHMLVLPIFITGLVLILFNPQTLRQLAFPIVFLFFLMPPPSEILYTLGAALSTLSSEVSSILASLLGVPSTLISEYGNPLILITRPDGSTMQFAVDIACSGIYSLIGFLIFATLVAYVIRDKPWKKIALILTGIPVIYLFNVIRITSIVTIGYYYGENLALQAFHLLGGWVLIFLGALLLLVISEKILKTQIFAAKPERCLQCNPKPQSNRDFCSACGRIIKAHNTKISKVDIVKIVTIITSVLLLLSIQAPVFALTQSPAIVIINTPTGQQASTEILPKISGYNLQFAYRDTTFEETAKQDMALAYTYNPENEQGHPFWVALEIASTRSTLHRWEVCLINYPLQHGRQPKVTQIELLDIQLTENPPIISRYFTFQYTKTNQTEAVLYWYEEATFTINSTSQQKNVKISLIAYPDNLDALPQIENQLVTFAKQIVDYWQPIKLWSPIAIGLSQNGAYLALATSLILAATTVLYALENKKQRKTNRNAYRKLSKPNRQLIDAIQETEKKATPTLNSIADAYQKTTGQVLPNDQLLQKLAELEKTGIIKSCITSKHDEPIQTWKTQN